MAEAPLTADDMLAAVYNLLVDRMAVDVGAALDQRGIPHILLKGPTIGQWLYDADEVRAYGDADILVPRSDWDATGAVLRELGFRESISILGHPRMESHASYPWTRGDCDLDLHSRLAGMQADDDTIWAVLSKDAVPWRSSGGELRALALPARALHIALHVVHHRGGHPIDDLQRAIDRLPLEIWEQAREVAAKVDATAAFATGLRLLPDGDRLARALGVHEERSIDAVLRVVDVPLAAGLEELARTAGLAPKLRMVARELAPTPMFMRWWSPLARRGRRGLAVAYLWRPAYLLFKAPAALAARRRVHREVGQSQPDHRNVDVGG